MKHIDQGILVVGFKCDVKADRGAGERLRRHFIKQTLDLSEHRLEMRERPQRGRSGGVRPKASDSGDSERAITSGANKGEKLDTEALFQNNCNAVVVGTCFARLRVRC